MEKTTLRSLFLLAVVLSSGEMVAAMAQEIPVGESSSGQVSISAKRKTEAYGAFSILGTIPKNKNLSSGETIIPNTDERGSAGAGLKAGVFPAFAGGIVGVEGEVFGHGGKLSAPQAQSNLTAVNLMVNLLARYPGEIMQPYVGVGVGLSHGVLSDANIQVRSNQLTGSAVSMNFGYQFLGGVRAYVTRKVFLFGEYKYFAVNYNWQSGERDSGNPSVNLKFQTQIVSGGVGITF